jgi:hypothetical protein
MRSGALLLYAPLQGTAPGVRGVEKGVPSQAGACWFWRFATAGSAEPRLSRSRRCDSR